MLLESFCTCRTPFWHRANGDKAPKIFTYLTFSYIGSVTARHSSSGRQPNSVARY